MSIRSMLLCHVFRDPLVSTRNAFIMRKNMPHTQKINLEGICVFGGVKGEKPNYDTYDDNLYRLSIGTR